MKKALLFVLMILLASGAFAQEQTWAKSYDKDLGLNIYASIGYWWGFTVSAGAEFIITEFKIGGVPFDFGIMVRGLIEFWPYGGTDWGAAPMASLHMGFAGFPMELYIAIGIGFYGYIGSTYWGYYSYGAFNVGFATFDGVIFHLSDSFGILIEFGYVGWTTIWGVGIKLSL